MAGDHVEDNLNPVGRAYYGFSTLLCTPSSLSQDVGLALGTQAGPARIRDVTAAGGFTRFRSVAETPVQPGLRSPPLTTDGSQEHTGGMATMSGQSRTWVRAQRRPRRALFLSSPIGLGHARRDVAIAQELRRLHPDLQIDWLAQHPVTRVLADAGETVHPASAWLANESAHIEDESADHDLHAFQAIRRMDEILVNNFMVFNDVVDETYYDLVIGDEAWDVDYFLHENPELKRFAFAWMTDFVGWLPMPSGGDAEAALTADYNAEMLEQRARYRRLRDRSIFVGNPDDVVDESLRTRAARHPRLDDGELRLRRLRHRIRAAVR